MIGATLSRWTMSYFAAALACLVAAEILMMLGFGLPNGTLLAPETLILVHLVAIGWLSLLMSGALLQFVPVLVAQPLYSNVLPLPALISLLAGLGALLFGFVQLGGWIGPSPLFFALAGALLGSGFGLVLWNLARTLWSAKARSLPVRFVMVGLASLVATIALGIIFALTLGGTIVYEPLVSLTAAGRPLHAIAGLGGWLTFSAMGVSYRLLAMFMLAPELDRKTTKAALYSGAAALAVAVVGGVLAVLLLGNLPLVLLTAGGLSLAAVALYGADMLHLYRARKRRSIELNSRMTTLALSSLVASGILCALLLALGQLTDHIDAVVFLIAFGWLSGLGLAQLYKIVAFLTWLECYGPVLGRMQTPRVQDLVVEARARAWFWLYFPAVWAGTLSLLSGFLPAFQASAAVMLLATCGIIAQLVRTRSLADVTEALRLPQGVQKPSLLFSLTHQS